MILYEEINSKQEETKLKELKKHLDLITTEELLAMIYQIQILILHLLIKYLSYIWATRI